eukprot:scaffold224891_cov36-Tisochrysis_lutea.AAC.4
MFGLTLDGTPFGGPVRLSIANALGNVGPTLAVEPAGRKESLWAEFGRFAQVMRQWQIIAMPIARASVASKPMLLLVPFMAVNTSLF